ncbi:MAG: glycosyltransferase family 4 protein [Anaerolineales bacterium]|nr:glycosyltransferase family 4 protein [Anaerolineales bacterium]
MKIGMILPDFQELGGMEEYAVTLAVGLRHKKHKVSVLSTAWVKPENQYLRRLRENDVDFFSLPKWVSHPVSDWATKEKITAKLVLLAAPLVWLAAITLSLVRFQPLPKSMVSAKHWLRAKVIRALTPDRRKPFVRLMLSWWKRIWKPEILHIQGYTNTLLFVIDWAHTRSLPLIYEEHQTPDARFDWWDGFHKSINKADVVIAVSETSAEALRNICGVTRPIVVQGPLVPDPVAAGWMKTPASPSDLNLRLTTLARLYGTKGLTYLLEALVQVRKKYPHVEAQIYGDGPLRPDLLSRAQSLGLDGERILAGPFTSREHLARIMAETDVFVMPSILEGQPVALVEAMSYGKPIIATAVGGIPELITDGENGLLCPPHNPIALAEKITALIENSTLRNALGRSARKSYERGPFQPDAVCDHFLSVYDRVLKEYA